MVSLSSEIFYPNQAGEHRMGKKLEWKGINQFTLVTTHSFPAPHEKLIPTIDTHLSMFLDNKASES
jgi:hypothetical protein